MATIYAKINIIVTHMYNLKSNIRRPLPYTCTLVSHCHCFSFTLSSMLATAMMNLNTKISTLLELSYIKLVKCSSFIVNIVTNIITQHGTIVHNLSTTT